MKWEFFCVTVLNIAFLTKALGPFDDPYEILGVTKSATVQELRKAYKKLAKEWHPDKNDDPEAATKFVEITQAYELLADPERRKQYDNHGTIDPDGNHKRQEFHFDEFDPFDDIFNFPQRFKFTSKSPDISVFHKLSVTTRAFENSLRPKSYTTPHLIFFFSDWCFVCIKIEPIWRRVIEELEPIGVELATVHSAQEPLLAKKCGVGSVPALVLLIEGKVYPFRESLYSIQKIVDFVRSKFPYKLIVNVKDENLNSFLEGWHDNRVRALVFQKTEPVRLRYLLMSFYFSERVFFGKKLPAWVLEARQNLIEALIKINGRYPKGRMNLGLTRHRFVRLNSPDTIEIQKKYKVSPEFDTLLLFNEDTNRPTASLSMSVIPVQTMKDVIFENKYLILPRLSSQKVLDSLCPVEWASRRKRLCVVLVSENTKEHDEPRKAMRQFAQESAYKSERVRFSYIYQEKQPEFVKSLLAGSPQDTVLNIVILWRRDVNHLKYEWMQGSWSSDKKFSEWNKTKERLESVISKLLRTDETLSYEAVVAELIDEQAQGLLGKILNKFFIAADVLRDTLGTDHVFAAASVVATIVFIVVGGYFMAYLVRQEEDKIKCFENQNGYQKMSSKSNGNANYVPELKFHELRAETYHGMVRLLKPGCRSIVLLLDQQSRNVLLPEFHKIIWPYRKNKALLTFGYMYIEKGLDWYKRLLILSLPEPRKLAINPKNCIGTVLSLCGHRKYFCMYHAKHPECLRGHGAKRILKMIKRPRQSDTAFDKLGSFMGFDDSSDSESDENLDVEQGTRIIHDKLDMRVILQSNLLKGLPNWLDRLFEGSTHRYYINYWPDFRNNIM